MLACLLCAPAHAALMFHHDLTSLALEADAVVRGKVVSERREDEWTTYKTVQIERVYYGPLKQGERLELSYDLYSMRPWGELWGQQDAARDGGRAVLGDDLVAFVRHADARGGRSDAGPAWHLVSSGLRIFLDGKAHRFEQWSNPGGFVPVPQGEDPFDLVSDPRGGAPVDREGLDRLLVRAVGRAETLRAVLSAPDTEARRERLVELAATPGLDADVASTTLSGFFRNRAAQRVVEALAATGDLRRTLRALTRAYGVDAFMMRQSFPSKDLLEFARNATHPVAERVSALSLYLPHRSRDEHSQEEVAFELLRDPQPLMRRSALELLTREKPSNAQRQMLGLQLARETDDGVRLAWMFFARERGWLALARSAVKSSPVIYARRLRDAVFIDWADADSARDWMVTSNARVRYLRAGSELGSEDLFGPATSYSNGAFGNLAMRLRSAASWGSEPLEVRLDLELEDHHVGAATARPLTRRTLALGMLTPSSLLAVGGSPTEPQDAKDAGVPAASDAAASDAGPIQTMPRDPGVPSPRAHACGCGVDDAAPVSVVTLLVPVWIAARRRRRTQTGLGSR